MLHRLSFRAMGCDMLAILEHDSESMPAPMNEIPTWFEEWEQSLSRFRIDSELSLLNRTFDQPIQVSEVFWDVFQTALQAHELSEGLVTPTVLDAMLESGYDRPFDSMPREQIGFMSPVEIHPLSMVVADELTRTITLPQGVHLDFGGVAKGWAAHQTVERIKELGPCLMNCGGDIAVSGPRADASDWEIGVSNPFEPESHIEVLKMKRAGVASSGRDRRTWSRNGQLHHHIINPLTGLPAETDVLRVTVVAPTVMEAETAAKTAFILGVQKGMEWLEAYPSFAGLMILDSGEEILNRKMQEYLQA